MTSVELLEGALKRSRAVWQRALRPDGAVKGPIPELPREQLVWRPAPGSHSIGRLLWHIADVEDRWLREFIQEGPFEPRFGKGSLDGTDNASIPAWDDLMAYLEETRERTLAALPAYADRLAEERRFYTYRSSIGFIFTFMVTHEAAHAGQIAHIMGMIRRGGW